jgi:hypothetical protein
MTNMPGLEFLRLFGWPSGFINGTARSGGHTFDFWLNREYIIFKICVLIPYNHGILKGPSHQINFAWMWYGSIGLGKNMRCLTFKNLSLSFYFCTGC